MGQKNGTHILLVIPESSYNFEENFYPTCSLSCRSTINTNKVLMEVIVNSIVYGREEEEDRMAVRMER